MVLYSDKQLKFTVPMSFTLDGASFLKARAFNSNPFLPFGSSSSNLQQDRYGQGEKVSFQFVQGKSGIVMHDKET